MKVLLGEPGRFHAEGGTEVHGKQTPNIGIAYVATNLKKEIDDCEVKVFDAPVEKLKDDDYIKLLKKFDPEIVGLTAMTFNILDAYKLFKLTKKFNSEIITVLGGCHATTLPKQTLDECTEIDICIAGEGEKTLAHLIEKKISGTNLMAGAIHSKPIEDLDDLPFPDWALFNYDNYSKAYSHKFEKDLHIYPVVSSRGCPFECVFCNGSYLGRKVRYRNSKNVIEELQNDILRFKSKLFYITDSNLTINRNRIIKMCKAIIEAGISDEISWKAQSRVDLTHKDVFDYMYKAGCELIFIGAESGSDFQLQKIGKNTNVKMIRKTVEMAKQAGLITRASFVLGLPYENQKRVMKTLKFANSLELDSYALHILDVYPGTKLYDMVDEGEGGLRWVKGIKKGDWSIYNRNTAMVEVNDINKEFLEDLIVKHR